MTQKTALVLSGGGALGAFEVGAEKYAREVKGYHWDIISGVSAGALNGAMLAAGRYQRLYELWNTISNDQVYTGGFNLPSIIKLLFGARSFYGNLPLQKLIAQEMASIQFQVELRFGAVSLDSGEYVQFDQNTPELDKALLASTAIPVVWSPVDVSPALRNMVDGGVRHTSPIGGVLDFEPDEVVIINCQSSSGVPPANPGNIVQIAQRSIDILLNGIFASDVTEFLRINQLVQQAQAQGVTLYNPRNGRPYKYFEYKLIEPVAPLGDGLDFSQPSVQRSLQAGLRRARQVLSS